MSHKQNNIAVFIREFNFSAPSWNNLPNGFPRCDTSKLPLEEKYLFDGIKLVYAHEHTGQIIVRSVAKATLYSLIIFIFGLISLIGLIKLATQPGENNITRTVNAATIQVDEFVQSTMSAILRK
jgi:hypothetical protein